MAKRGNALSRSRFVLRTPMGRAMAKKAGVQMATGAVRNVLGMAATVAGTINFATGSFVVGGALVAAGAYQMAKGQRNFEKAQMGRAVARFRELSARAAIAKGAASRSKGRQIEANRSGGTRVASSVPVGSNGQVNGYYRMQGGKSVFVQGYARHA